MHFRKVMHERAAFAALVFLRDEYLGAKVHLSFLRKKHLTMSKKLIYNIM